MKHLAVLEAGGMVGSRKVGRTRTYQIRPDALDAAARWVEERRAAMHAAFDRLDRAIAEFSGGGRMTLSQPITHTEFTIERRPKTSPRHAFRFWSEPELKSRWNDCHADWRVLEDAFDFRVGGAERKHWRTSEGQDLTFTAHYLDIIAEARIIYAYEMSFAARRLSASLVTVTFAPSGGATLMTFTEQVAILDGGAGARQQQLVGTEEGMDRLVELVDEVVGAR